MKKFTCLVVFVLLMTGMMLAETYPRNETLYETGGLWEPPSNWNPLVPWAAVTGTIGLIYETLFAFDPLKGELIPWLAEEGRWVNATTYRLTLRKGLAWQDGKPLTAEDVKFTFELAKKIKGIYYSTIWTWLKSIEILDDYTLYFKFSTPKYHEWTYQLYQISILPKHIWEKKTEDEILSGSNEGAIGSGPYLFHTYTQDRMVYKRNENWWGKKLLSLEPKPKYVVCMRFLSNNVALGALMKGELDISNDFLPNIASLKRFYGDVIHTWFDGPPYMLSDDTVFLFMNTRKKPMDDPKFRRALAFAINTQEIVDRVYQGQVVAANPLGFLPCWMDYYDEEVVKKYGFSYNPEKAAALLDKAGYKDVDGDGWREAPDGSEIELTIIVPYGWTDWMEAIKIIARDFERVGINVAPKFPDYSKYEEDMAYGKFDMLLNNFGAAVSATVWTLFNFLFTAIQDEMWDGNFGRYENPEVSKLVEQFNETPLDQVEKGKEIASKIEEIFLKDMPAIPLWYNGMWFQANTTYWKNWPSEKNPYAYPVTWPGMWLFGGTLVLMHVTPAE